MTHNGALQMQTVSKEAETSRLPSFEKEIDATQATPLSNVLITFG